MPEQQQQQVTFPVTQLNITPQGLQITTVLSPGCAFQQFIDEPTMNQVVQQWRESRRQLSAQQELVRDVLRTKH